jgi:hypothetical protein
MVRLGAMLVLAEYFVGWVEVFEDGALLVFVGVLRSFWVAVFVFFVVIVSVLDYALVVHVLGGVALGLSECLELDVLFYVVEVVVRRVVERESFARAVVR